jgi:hypothetical protein
MVVPFTNQSPVQKNHGSPNATRSPPNWGKSLDFETRPHDGGSSQRTSTIGIEYAEPEVKPQKLWVSFYLGVHPISMDWFKGKFTGKPHI